MADSRLKRTGDCATCANNPICKQIEVLNKIEEEQLVILGKYKEETIELGLLCKKYVAQETPKEPDKPPI